MITHIGWDITSKCNFNCPYCGVYSKCEDLPTDMMIKIAKNIGNLGVKAVIIAGGEPFLRKDIFEILQVFKDYPLDVYLLTNGSLINDEAVKKLMEYSNVGIRLSLEFGSPQKYDRFHGVNGLFDRLSYATNQLVAHGIETGINVPLFQENIGEISQIIDYAIKHNCKFVRFVPILSIGRAKYFYQKPDIYAQALREIISQVITRRELFAGLGFSPLPMRIEDFARNFVTPCNAGTQFLNVTPEGYIKLCPLLPSLGADLSAMELNNAVSVLSEISYELFQVAMLKGKCKKCALKNLCRGGCPANKVSNGLSLYAEQPTCVIDLIEEALSDMWISPGVKEMLSEISQRMSMQQNTCFRSLPIWIYFNKSIVKMPGLGQKRSGANSNPGRTNPRWL